jgi:hypothetical protein
VHDFVNTIRKFCLLFQAEASTSPVGRGVYPRPFLTINATSGGCKTRAVRAVVRAPTRHRICETLYEERDSLRALFPARFRKIVRDQSLAASKSRKPKPFALTCVDTSAAIGAQQVLGFSIRR